MRAFTMNSKGKTLMSVFTSTIQFLRLHVQTLIKVFPLEFIVKARMFEHAFLGRFRDEIIWVVSHRPAFYVARNLKLSWSQSKYQTQNE